MKKIILYAAMICLLLNIFNIAVFANTDASPHIEGEMFFNDTVDAVMNGELTLNPIKIINGVVSNFASEISDSLKLILTLLLISTLSSVISVLSGSFGEKAGSEAAFLACFTMMSGLGLKCFNIALGYASDVIEKMTAFITKLSPAFMLAVAASGTPVSAAAFSPVLSGAVYIVSLLIKNALVPLMTFSAVLGVVGGISDRVQLNNFCRVIRSVTKWLMAATITLFTGISSLYGFNSSAADAMGTKTVKFAVGSLVPVVGGFLSDTLETVVSGTRLMKNAMGTAGIIVILTICILPVIKIFTLQLILKISAAVAEPVTDKRISKMLWEISEAVTTVFGVTVMTVVLFLINITLIIIFTNSA